ncbi:Uncharacterised protein [Vibrio cholerae]|nr:Uncharacterised protein [Vibrio cholerae]
MTRLRETLLISSPWIVNDHFKIWHTFTRSLQSVKTVTANRFQRFIWTTDRNKTIQNMR